MKILLLVPLVLFFIISPVYGQLSDATGLVTRLDVQAGGQTFDIEIISNFEISDYDFDNSEKKLTIHINSGLENNLGEIILPQNLLRGDLAFYLNDQEFFPKINSNEKISFVVLDFTGSGENKLEIFGTNNLDDFSDNNEAISKESFIPQKEEILFDSFELLAFIALSILIGVFIVVKMIKIKKQNKNL